tara:strand:+ start:57 stop:518 length:462 start_codon:yes stop_codon:yes gene_type:complete
MEKNIKGISILESLVCLVIIGIGFVAMLQLSSFSINAMDRSIEKNKMNFLSEMVLEDMLGDPDNVSNYSLNQSSCNYTNNNASRLYQKNINKWKDKLRERDYIKFDDGSGYKDKKLRCMSGDIKKVIVNNGVGKVNFFTGKGKRKKYLGVVAK